MYPVRSCQAGRSAAQDSETGGRTEVAPAERPARPRLLVDVFSVGSPRHAVLYDQRHYLSNNRMQVNPTYGAVTQYQPPMSARVGMVLDF